MIDQQLQQERMDKIRALLAKAEGTSFPEEAKAFAQKAEELMLKWAIDDAMLQQSKTGSTDDGTIDKTSIWIDANEFRGPKIDLLSAIAGANNVKIVLYGQTYRNRETGEIQGYREAGFKRQFKIVMVGFERDRRFVEMLFTSLLLQSELEFLNPEIQLRLASEVDEGGHSIRWRNAFMRGYNSSIRVRLANAKKNAERDAQVEASRYSGAPSLAVVLVGKTAVVEAKFREFFPKLKSGRGSSAGLSDPGSARSMGLAAGNRADIGTVKVGQRKGVGQIGM